MIADSSIKKLRTFPEIFLLAWHGICASYHGVIYIGDCVNKEGIDASRARLWGKTRLSL